MTENKNYKVGMVFGVFDGLHEGHKYFLNIAKKQCDKLIVVVAQDKVVEIMKNRTPKNNLENRIEEIKLFAPDLVVIPGDKASGGWQVLKENNPDIIFLGYDQEVIARELDKLNTPYIFIDSHFPEKYKSSLL